MKYSGYIEGFYGKYLTWEQRRKLILKLSQRGMNCYFYAAKEDPQHRISWRESYTPEESEAFRAGISFAHDQGVQFIPSLAPGLSYRYTDEDYYVLCARFDAMAEWGISTIALCMDDIPSVSPAGISESLGVLHGTLLSQLCKRYPQYTIMFCPTIYAEDLIQDSVDSRRYLDDLQKTIPASVMLFWTGESTISPRIERASCSVLDSFDNPIVFWDNYYATDYAPNRLFVGTYENRDRVFCTETCAGIMINGTGFLYTDCLLLDIVGVWSAGNPLTIEEHEELLRRASVPEKLFAYLPWMSSPYTTASSAQFLAIEDDPFRFFTEMIAQWQSPLKQEWYPALHALFTEIRLGTQKGIPGDTWYDMRYLPIIASCLRKG